MLLFLNLFSLAFGQVTHPLSEVNATQLSQVLQASANTSSATNRLLEISASFLGRPYLLGPAGEGVDGDFDQRPLSTWEKFDCVTYVEAVLALSLIHNPSNDPQANLQMYYQNLIEIKYSDDNNISFLTRNHFTEIIFSNWGQSSRINSR